MFRRNIQERLQRALQDTPVVLLAGARQTGKTTLARLLAEQAEASYVTLDDATVLAAASTDPIGFLRGLGARAVSDEAQKAPALFPAIKVSVDAQRSPGRYLLTGSANIQFIPKVAESLAGRIEVLTLYPLSQGELSGKKERLIDRLFAGEMPAPDPAAKPVDLIAAVAAGGFPEAIERADEQRRDAWFGAYLSAILQRDVRDIAHIEGLTELPRLLALLASRSGGLLNASDLARASAIPQTTLKRYLALLEATYLHQPLPAWSRNLGSRLVKAPKIHLVDSGLSSYLTGRSPAALREDAHAFGQQLETFVVAELRKHVTWQATAVQAYHYRALHSSREVDVVVEDRRGAVVGIEVKAAATVHTKDFNGLKDFAAEAKGRFRAGVVLYTGDQPVAFGERLFALPTAALWATT